jgi:hypothetical protein
MPRSTVLFAREMSSGQLFNIVENITVYNKSLEHAVAYSYRELILPSGDSQDEK